MDTLDLNVELPGIVTLLYSVLLVFATAVVIALHKISVLAILDMEDLIAKISHVIISYPVTHLYAVAMVLVRDLKSVLVQQDILVNIVSLIFVTERTVVIQQFVTE
jgi:hypothetical protein